MFEPILNEVEKLGRHFVLPIFLTSKVMFKVWFTCKYVKLLYHCNSFINFVFLQRAAGAR